MTFHLTHNLPKPSVVPSTGTAQRTEGVGSPFGGYRVVEKVTARPIHLLTVPRCQSVTRFSDVGMIPLEEFRLLSTGRGPGSEEDHGGRPGH